MDIEGQISFLDDRELTKLRVAKKVKKRDAKFRLRMMWVACSKAGRWTSLKF
jgi:hypothetical protein